MNGTSKCGKCARRDDCQIRESLNEIIREAIKLAENEVRQLTPKQIDYMIVTDMAIIPINCHQFMCRDNVRKMEPTTDKGNLFSLGILAPTAI
ncbi:hypothetical protein Desca_1173 [Desulfotomaculum nigrificans CO-1-SRB]|uniref:Uncharacterized protein n=1 Tax=Desulfotomaculum nigrificans (strain DSM 14880 / VKM B-2319 / CO-1-SRB) TaxID=868595 RepID=F6B3K8_DESCC|nr:hypothetical protein Desca_1173 [Desulfotomaculum nigrificans CO-1-SRB]